MTDALLLATLAGLPILIGGWLATFERFLPRWLDEELRHSVVAFGGGVLISAVTLVLVPQGMAALGFGWGSACFALGGLAFMGLDAWLARRGGSMAQLVAMLMDFVPEAMALGAMLTENTEVGLLLALLIALQNLPEGFNAFRELRQLGTLRSRRILALFALFVLLGPLSAWLGHTFLSGAGGILGGIMLFAGGGILYLTFGDIAPQAKLRNHWGPPLGAVAGYWLGLWGHQLLGGA
ncbi:ZIP family metal transporter [Gallaecimonas xiamenensis]|uniref:Zinc/iron permease n=1 Tax=Gallaecimonas xiamenensis 3-C-1 TaxID=745411 RepID=K2K902_9GAMM|nr:divalent cation transporter [Gallaecimonas xiamenensis]EKE73760.1 zinc/iron permease [Gallaecimonas xiamenensis 3-C-1]